MEKRWMLKGSSLDIKKLASEADIDLILANILVHRGIKNPKEMKMFLNVDTSELHNGSSMKDMDKAVAMIKNAIFSKKKIYVYGDYDVDGVMSTYILYRGLKECGADVRFHIPHRENEGYGMNTEVVKRIKEEGCDLIITCDNGIAAFEQVEEAKKLGMEVIITDHHDIPFVEEGEDRRYVIPAADAVVNPKQKQCEYSFKYLCGGGIAYKFIEKLYEQMDISKLKTYELMQYAAISTICDVVDLVSENRVIAKTGLEMLNTTENMGLRALIKECGLEDKRISAYHIGFIIGPCINATGRLETAKLSLELLLSQDEEEAAELAKRLKELNEERQIMTNKSVERAIDIINRGNMLKDRVLVIYDEEIHESIAGIVAGRIKERYNLPAIVLTKGKEMAKGSARSIEEYNMFEELVKCKELLSKFGGHPMAAGMSIEQEKISALRNLLNENCSLKDEDLIPKVRIDQKLPLKYVSFPLINELKQLEPFGKGNPSPIFAEKNIVIDKIYLLGKNKNVIKFIFRFNDNRNSINGIYFEGEEFREMIEAAHGEEYYKKFINGYINGVKVDIIYYPEINEYNGSSTLQLIIKDIRLSVNI